MGKIITNSPNISVLDSNVVVDLKNGVFKIDLSPSIFIGVGATNVLGAKVKVKGAYGVIKDYDPSYDIVSPMTDVVTVSIPKTAKAYQNGSYSVFVQITDADGVLFELEKSGISICPTDKENKTKKIPRLLVSMDASCKAEKLFISADAPPAYNGVLASEVTRDFRLKYPYGALTEEVFDIPLLGVPLIEGTYLFSGTAEATYHTRDNISYIVGYDYKQEKNVKCRLDEGCISAGLLALVQESNSEHCSFLEKEDILARTIQTLLLIQTIKSASEVGADVSDMINDLEVVLGCACTCNSAEGTPITGGALATDIIISGCNIPAPTMVGTTVSYTIPLFDKIITIADNGGIISIGAVTTNGCVKSQAMVVDFEKMYVKNKTYINTLNEYNYWAGVIKASLVGLDTACLNITEQQFKTMTFKQFIQKLVSALCSGSTCGAEILTIGTSSEGSDVMVLWTANTGTDQVDIVVDNVVVGTVLSSKTSFRLKDFADGLKHEYIVRARCANGALGKSLDGTFIYNGCPTIAYPTLTGGDSFNNAVCPFDLFSTVSGAPTGITYEWHTANNTLASTKVANASSVPSGVYYAFAKNSDNCYSIGIRVTIVCAETSNCSAPQNLLAEAITGAVRVRFQSATYAPPSNSYNVLRRLSSDPDVSGSYTAIGAASWNASVNRWEVVDHSATINNTYVYRAVSNCVASSPYADYVFAYAGCPVLSLTPTKGKVSFQFVPGAGGVTKYEVSLYDNAGTTLLNKATFLPSFTNPTAGDFPGLQADTMYKAVITTWLGVYSMKCDMYPIKTLAVLPPQVILGTVETDGESIIINTVQAIPCGITIPVGFKYTDGSLSQDGSDSVPIAANAMTGTNAPAIPNGNTVTDINPTVPGESKVTFVTTCAGVEYTFSLAIFGSSAQYQVDYGYTFADTTGMPLSEQQYLDSITAASGTTSSMSATPGNEINVSSFGNADDRVCFLRVPINIAFPQFNIWSELLNPLQQNQYIDPNIGTGSNVWFKAVAGGYRYYITRSQTIFGGTINFKFD